MLVWRERRKNLWSSRGYTRTFIQVVGEVGFSPPALRRTSWTQQKKKKKSSYTFNLPPFRNMKNSRQKSDLSMVMQQVHDTRSPSVWFLLPLSVRKEESLRCSSWFRVPSRPGWLFPVPSECISFQILMCRHGFGSVKAESESCFVISSTCHRGKV